jgi:2'-5' RNA ligase
MRLFIAIHFSPGVREVLLSAIDSLRAQAVSGNFTRPENLHLTLAFIGESNDPDSAAEAIDAAAVPPFFLAVRGFGHFGDLWWVGIEKNPALTGLAESLQESLRRHGFEVDKRPFRPHITLARQVELRGAPQLCIPRTGMTVSRISLMKSERIRGKLTYTEIYGRELKPEV